LASRKNYYALQEALQNTLQEQYEENVRFLNTPSSPYSIDNAVYTARIKTIYKIADSLSDVGIHRPSWRNFNMTENKTQMNNCVVLLVKTCGCLGHRPCRYWKNRYPDAKPGDPTGENQNICAAYYEKAGHRLCLSVEAGIDALGNDVDEIVSGTKYNAEFFEP
jgi:hypothetical protein